MGPEGFVGQGAVEGLLEGDHFDWRTANGEEVSGVVHMAVPSHYFGGTLERLNDSLFGITVEGAMVFLSFYFYGVEEGDSQALVARWTELVQSAVGAAASSPVS
jgi:hypothetical protein